MQTVFIGEGADFCRDQSLRENKVAFANHLLIINLSLTDLLMGFYLLSLCIVDIQYSGIYCLKSVKWLYSTTCTALGTVVLISSEASVLTLLLLATVRLITFVDVSILHTTCKYTTLYTVSIQIEVNPNRLIFNLRKGMGKYFHTSQKYFPLKYGLIY